MLKALLKTPKPIEYGFVLFCPSNYVPDNQYKFSKKEKKKKTHTTFVDLIVSGSQWLKLHNVICLWLSVHGGYIYSKENKTEKQSNSSKVRMHKIKNRYKIVCSLD